MRRVAPIVVALAVLAAACGTAGTDAAPGGSRDDGTAATGNDVADRGDGGDATSAGDTAFPCTADPIASSPRDVVASGLEWLFGRPFPDGFPEPLLAGSLIIPVLRADGIPAIDAPMCHRIEDVDFLDDDEAVVVIELNGEARAYPLQILTWHELVNDTVGGVAVTVSYCPLCNSAIAYDRAVGERVLDFGTSGALHQSSMVMYDRQTHTLWTHFDGTAVAGALTGTELDFFPTAVVSWATFRAEHPDGLVLSRDTANPRDYGRNPYVGYELAADPIDSFITNDVDPRLPAKDRVLGVEIDGEAIAIPHADLFEVGVVAFELAGRRLVAWNQPGTASALDSGRVDDGIDVGTSVVFDPQVDGETLTFRRTTEGFVDDQTGSTWSILGRAVAGRLEGTRLEAVPALDTFWFAWGTFHDSTAILGG